MTESIVQIHLYTLVQVHMDSHNPRHRREPPKGAGSGKTQEPIDLMTIFEESFGLISILTSDQPKESGIFTYWLSTGLCPFCDGRCNSFIFSDFMRGNMVSSGVAIIYSVVY